MQSKQAIPLFIALVSLITFSLPATSQIDSVKSFRDSMLIDSAVEEKGNEPVFTLDSIRRSDTIQPSNLSKDALTSRVTYKARDTIKYNFAEQKVFLYGEAIVMYEDIELRAEYIELKMDSNIVFATGVKDSTGKVIGSPVFKEGDTEYRSQRMTYNFMTEKGKIDDVITQDGEGYVHGEDVKKVENDVIYIQNGLYTTCDHDHPHFSIWAKQLKVIPNDKIIVKPANLIIEDVNTPILVPFGVFPNRKRGKSGILVPMPGESERDGFYLFNAGYYFYMSEKADFEVEADIYSKGSYAVRPTFNYKKKYKYSGWIKMRHKNSITGVIPEDPNYSVTKDYWLDWNHRQEPGARPNSSFSANVNLGTSTSYKNDLNTPDDLYLKSNFSSKVSYTKYMLQKKANFSLNARQNQNNGSSVMNLTLPEAALNVQRFYPFKSSRSATSKWYENIGISYSSNFRNDLSINTDSVPFSTENLDTIQNTFKNGVRHSIPIGTNIKVAKHFTLNPSVNYQEIWYFESIEKTMDPNDTNHLVKKTVNPEFERGNNISASANLTTKLYGMMQFKRGYIRAFRHVMTPSVGLSYTPENTQGLRSYTDYSDSIPKQVEYSIFEDGIYGRPNTRESGKINFGLLNSFEMKVKAKSDTGDGTKKIKLLENLRFGGAYDFIKDSLQWDKVSVTGNSSIAKQLTLNLASLFDLYSLKQDSLNNYYVSNVFEYEKNGKLARLSGGSVGFTFNLTGGKSGSKGKSTGVDQDRLNWENRNNPDYNPDSPNNEDDYGNQNNGEMRKQYAQIDWDVPWNLSVSFSLQYQQRLVKDLIKNDFTTSTQANGDLSLTKNWKITYNVWFDTETLKINYARLGITRNLHCWQMTMDWVPTGDRKSYNFHIGVRANILQDLKLDKRSF